MSPGTAVCVPLAVVLGVFVTMSAGCDTDEVTLGRLLLLAQAVRVSINVKATPAINNFFILLFLPATGGVLN
jgi:hypothetical protein